MRRLLEWLDVSHIVSGTAHVAVGFLCLSLVGGAFVFSATSTSATTKPALVASARDGGVAAEGGSDVVALRVGADDAAAALKAIPAGAPAQEAASILVPAVFRSADAGMHDAVSQPVLKIKLTDLEKERQCLVEGIYYEARGERAVGQLAVAEVVLNRVLSGRYPSTICGVVFQGAKTGRCQFSFACDSSMKHPRNMVAWRKAQRLAHYVLSGKVRNSLVGSATYYHASYVNPYWAPSMVEVAKIGQHVFYRSAADGLPADPQL
jgi:spore germination cell wall hydrolase CwlJ-like protein